MDSVRMTNEIVMRGRRTALIAGFICRLVTFCLLYSTPALAHDSRRAAQAPVRPAAAPLAAETLDPKHDKDHDEDREGEHGRGHSHGM